MKSKLSILKGVNLFMKKINTKIPNVMFQKIKEYSNEEKDTRYIKAKIWIMHTKQNYNNSYFSVHYYYDCGILFFLLQQLLTLYKSLFLKLHQSNSLFRINQH